MKRIVEYLVKVDRPIARVHLIRYIESELTDMGGSPKTIENYLYRLAANGLVKVVGNAYTYTQTGKNWLERKVS